MPQTTTKETVERKFIQHLRSLHKGPRAVIRRCLSASPPSSHLPAYPYIERHIPRWFGSGEERRPTPGWRREQFYLVAGLFARIEEPSHQGKTEPTKGETITVPTISLASAVRSYSILSQEASSTEGADTSVASAPQDNQRISSTERRFLTLLDSDPDQLPYRLRQIVLLITRGQNGIKTHLDWAQLLRDLRFWNSSTGSVRRRWAKEFFAPCHDEIKSEET